MSDRPHRNLRRNTRLTGYVTNARSNENLRGRGSASPSRPNVAVERATRGGRRGRGRRQGTGASHSPQQAASATIAATVDTEESSNGNQTGASLVTSDASMAMGVASAELAANFAGLRVAILALFSILNEDQIKEMKEMHSEENNEMLKEMLSHADSSLLARMTI